MPHTMTKRLCKAVALALAVICCSICSQLSRAAAASDAPGTEPTQPVAFSHKLHSEQKLDCATCHENPDPGENMTIPNAELCMTCHQSIAAQQPAVKRLAQFASENKVIPLVRIYSLPAFVVWSHRTHVAAGVACEACHGDVAAMDVIRATNVTTMDACVDCHDKKGANTGCVTCHESRSP